jgi:hypothetical protein
MWNRRHLSFYCDLCIPSKDDSIAVINSGCDQPVYYQCEMLPRVFQVRTLLLY